MSDYIENQDDLLTQNGLNYEFAVFGGGCFWCTEAIFKNLKGVISVTPGYTGGEEPNPNYDEACTGVSGHVEVVKVEYDPSIISYENLLAVFFSTHDPTTKNRQGNDIGTQYKSVIFYYGEHQKYLAENYIEKLETEKILNGQITTEILPLTEFYEAEDYHKNYFETHKNIPYCQIIIEPKISKLREKFDYLINK